MSRPQSLWKGGYVFIDQLTDEERAHHGLSTADSIVEVIGTEENEWGRFDALDILDYAYSRPMVAFDLETDGSEEFSDDEDAGLDPHKGTIILCQIGDDERQYLIWWKTIGPEAKALLRQLWVNPECRKAGVNLKFDAKMLLANEGLDWRGERLIDTQIAEQVIGCGLVAEAIGLTMKLTGMGPMAKRWLGWVLPKDEDIRTGWGSMTPGKWYPTREEHESAAKVGAETRTYDEVVRAGLRKRYYAADDCVVPVRLALKQAPWLREFGLLETFKLEMEFLPVLAEMEVRGMPMDWAMWTELAREAEQAKLVAEHSLDALFTVSVTTRTDLSGNIEETRDKNYGSNDELKQLIRDWMFERYGIEVIGSNKMLKDAAIRGGLRPERAEKLFRQRLVPDPNDSTKKKQVAYPKMADLITGSPFVDSIWDEMLRFLPPNSFALESTDSDVLRLLRIIHETDKDRLDDVEGVTTHIGLPPELVDPILAHREATTKMSRYAWSWEKLINPVTGRVHTDASQAAADAARVQTRPNYQNLPADPRYRRAACTARPGYKIVGADFSQIEPRIIAEISMSPMYMRVFWSERPGTPGFDYWCGPDVTEPLDLYGATGAAMSVLPKEAERKSVAKLPEHKKGRSKSKTAVLGLGYGTGKPKFHISYCLDTKEYQERDEADRLFDAFWTNAAEVKATLDELSSLAYPGAPRRNQKASPRRAYHPIADCEVTWSQTLGGRRRFFDPASPSWWTQGRNHPVQGTGADILKRTCVELARWMWAENIDGFLILTAHDELIAEVLEEQAPAVAKKMEEVMSAVGEQYCPHVPVSAEAYIEDFWLKD